MKDILPLEHMEINDPNSHSLPRKNFLQLAGMFGGALAVPDILSKKEFISSNPVSTYLSTTISGINGAYRFLVTTGENPNTNGLNYIPDVNINMVGIEKITDDSIELTNLGQILTTAPFEKQSQIRAGVKLFEYRGIPITQDMVQVGKDGKTTQLADLAKDVFSNLNGDGYILGDIRLRVIEAPGQKHSDTSLRISIHSEDDKVVATNINLIEVQPKKPDSNQIKFDYTANKIVLRGYQRPELKPEVQPSQSMLTTNALENGKWGDYSLIENPDGYYEMKDVQGNLIPEVKLFRDGTAELTYSSKKLAVAFEAITIGPEGQLAFGLWNYENGIWSMADTPSIVEVANATEKIDSQGLVIKLGSENTETMWQTAFAARDLLVFDNPSYDPGSELSGISMKVGTEIVDNFDKPPSKWQLFNNNMAVKGAVTMLPVPPAGYNELLYTADMQKNMKGRPFLVALAAGMVPITFVNADDSVQEVAYLVPLIIRDTDSKLIAASTLMREEHIKEIASALNKEKRGFLIPWLFTRAMADDGYSATDMKLTEIMADRNRPIINELMPLLGGKVKVHLRSFPKKLHEALFILQFDSSEL